MAIGSITNAHVTYSDNAPTVAVPSGAVAGNVYALFLSNITHGATLTWPDGFTEVSDLAYEANSGADLRCALRVATGSESGSFTGSTTSWQSWRTVCAVVTGISATPDDVNGNGTYAYTSSASLTGASITTTGADRVILWAAATLLGGSAATPTLTPPAGLTTDTVVDFGNGSTLALADGTQATAGAATYNGTMSFGGVAEGRAALILTLAFPSSGGGGGPSITSQPSHQAAAVGASATFSVTATSSGGSLTYEWWSAPATYGLSNVPGVWAAISGATSASYSISSTSTSDLGKWYRCVVTDDNGSVTSTHARMFVLGLGVSGKGALEFGTGWMMGFRKSRQQQSNMLVRKQMFPGDTDATEATIWGNFLLPPSQAAGVTVLDDVTFSASQVLGHNQTLAVTLDGVTFAASQVASHPQTLAVALADVTFAAAQTLAHDQTLAATLADVTFVAVQSKSGSVSQALAVTLSDVTFTASQTASHPQTLTATLADVTFAATQTLAHDQALAATLADVTFSASQSKSGSAGQALAVTLEDVAFTASQTLSHSQTLAATLEDVAFIASQSVTGATDQTLTVNLDDVTFSAGQTLTHSQALAVQLADVTFAASQSKAGSASQALAVALADVSFAATQTLAHDQTLAVALADISFAATQTKPQALSQYLAVTLADVTFSATQGLIGSYLDLSTSELLEVAVRSEILPVNTLSELTAVEPESTLELA